MLQVVKSNLSARRLAIRYRILPANDASRIEWIDEVDVPLQDEKPSRLLEAERFLLGLFDKYGGAIRAILVKREVADAALAWRTIVRAKEHLGIRAGQQYDEFTRAHYWVWMPPARSPARTQEVVATWRAAESETSH